MQAPHKERAKGPWSDATPAPYGNCIMTTFRIDNEGSAVSVELTDTSGRAEALLDAFAECQSGHCTCPTDEYRKLESMNVQHTGETITLHLEAKPGSALDSAAIANCLEHTVAKVEGA